MTTQEFLRSILLETVNLAAQASAYSSWSDKFSRQELRDAWQDNANGLRRQRERRVTVKELQDVPIDASQQIGFCYFEDNLLCIPLWAFNYIAYGETLESISGRMIVK